METQAEFRFLTSDAARVGHAGAIPAVDRVPIDTADGVVSALRFMPDEAPRIITLHGAGLNAHSFDPFLLALGVPAASIDLPGHGRSEWRADADYGPGTIAPAVASAIRELAGGSPVVLLGHSLGGLTAMVVAATHPELVEHLIVVDITPGVSPSGDAGSVAEFITGQRDYGSVDEIVDRAIAFDIGHDRAALTRGVELNTRRRPDGRLEWTHHFAHLDTLPSGTSKDPHPYALLWEVLRAVAAPVTLIRAENGIVATSLADEWEREMPDSAVTQVAGPHNVHEAAPVELARAVAPLL